MAEEHGGAERHLREASFSALIDFLASQAYIGLGAVNHPQTEKPVLDLVYAKHAIDLLTIIEGKTTGNLTAPEKNYMENVLYQLRMTFMRMKQVAQASTDETPDVAEDADQDDHGPDEDEDNEEVDEE